MKRILRFSILLFAGLFLGGIRFQVRGAGVPKIEFLHQQGNVYLMKGATWQDDVKAYDENDQDITDQLQITGDTVNQDLEGDYKLNYQVTSGGHTVNKSRIVKVRDFNLGRSLKDDNHASSIQKFDFGADYKNFTIERLAMNDYSGNDFNPEFLFGRILEISTNKWRPVILNLNESDHFVDPNILTSEDITNTTTIGFYKNPSSSEFIYSVYDNGSRKFIAKKYNYQTKTVSDYISGQLNATVNPTNVKYADSHLDDNFYTYLLGEDNKLSAISYISGNMNSANIASNVTTFDFLDRENFFYVQNNSTITSQGLAVNGTDFVSASKLERTFADTQIFGIKKYNDKMYAFGRTLSQLQSNGIYKKDNKEYFIAEIKRGTTTIEVLNLHTADFELEYAGFNKNTFVFKSGVFDFENQKFVETKMKKELEISEETLPKEGLRFWNGLSYVYKTNGQTLEISKYSRLIKITNQEDKTYNYSDTIIERPVGFSDYNGSYGPVNYQFVKTLSSNYNEATDQNTAGNYELFNYYTLEGGETFESKAGIFVNNRFTKNYQSAIANNQTFTGSLTLDILGATKVLVNSEEVAPNSTHDLPGTGQTITVEGKNGYSKTLNFTIEVVYNISYTGSESVLFPGYMAGYASVSISGGTVKINGFPFDPNNMQVAIAGDSELKIYGYNNQVVRTDTIKLAPDCSGITDGQVFPEDVASAVLSSTNHTGLLLNNSPYTSGTPITEAGNHVIKVKGAGGFVHTINFTIPIKVTVTGTLIDGVYQGSASVSYNRGSASLNGTVLPVGTVQRVTSFGHNRLVLSGRGGYQKTLEIDVKFIYSGFVNNGKGTDPFTPMFSVEDNTKITVNGAPYNPGELKTVSKYRFEIEGATPSDRVTLIYEIEKQVQPGVNFNLESSALQTLPMPAKVFKGIYLYKIGGPTNAFGPGVSEIDNSTNPQEFPIFGVSGIYNVRIYDFNNPTTPTAQYRIKVPVGSSIIDNHIYYGEELTFGFSNTAKLRHLGFEETITSPHTVTGYGKYILKQDGLADKTFYLEPYENLDGKGFKASEGFKIEQKIFDNASEVRLDGNIITSETVLTNVKTYILKVKNGDDWEKTYTFSIIPEINVEENAEYTGSKVITFDSGTPRVDGILISNNQTINKVGEHKLTFDGLNNFERKFTILPSFTGTVPVSKKVYYGTVKFQLENSATAVKLDGTTYSGTVIPVGVHELEILGTNNYSKKYYFTVLPEDYKLHEDCIYTNGTTVTNTLNLFYNGNLETADFILNKEGKNEVGFKKGTEEAGTINFFVIPEVTGVEEGGIYTGSVKVNSTHYNFKLDGEAFNIVNPITKVGKHTLSVVFPDNSQADINFTIKATIENLDLSQSPFTGPVTPTINSVDRLELNGESYTSGTLINEAGNHVLKIFGTKGYVETVNFKIKAELEGIVSNAEYDTKELLLKSKNGVLVSEVTVSDVPSITNLNQKVTAAGIYTITLVGKNGYTNVYTGVQLNVDLSHNLTGVTLQGTSAKFKFTNTTDAVLDYRPFGTNERPYVSEEEITEYAHYRLTLRGNGGYIKTVDFTVHHEFVDFPISYNEPTVQNLDVNTYKEYSLNKLNHPFKVNGTTVSDGKLKINDIGSYQVVVDGLGDYHEEINFIALPGFLPEDQTKRIGKIAIENKLTNVKYYKVVNGEEFALSAIDGKYTLDLIGKYILKVYNSDKVFSKTYTYYIAPAIASDSLIKDELSQDFLSTDNPSLKFAPGQNYQSLTLNSQPYVSGTAINRVGNHRIEITGINSHIFTINFTVNPDVYVKEGMDINKFIDGETYQSGIELQVRGMETNPSGVTLSNASNTITYQYANQKINSFGAKVLKVIGTGGYSKEYHFTLTVPVFSAIAGQEYEYSHHFEPIEGFTFKLNDNSYNNTDIIEAGNHELKLVDSKGEESHPVSFVVKPGIPWHENETFTTEQKTVFNGIREVYINNQKVNGYTFNQTYSFAYLGHVNVKLVGRNGYEKSFDVTFNLEVIEELKTAKLTARTRLNSLQGLYESHFTFKFNNNSYLHTNQLNLSGSFKFVLTDSLGNTEELTLNVAGELIARHPKNGVLEDEEFLDVYQDGFKEKVTLTQFGYQQVLLDGNDITNTPTVLQLIGNHRVTLKKHDGETIDKDFELSPVFVEEKSSNDVVVLKIKGKFTSGTITKKGVSQPLDPSADHYDLTEAGIYDLTLDGHNKSYDKRINVHVDIKFYDRNNDLIDLNDLKTKKFEFVRVDSNLNDLKLDGENFDILDSTQNPIRSFGKHKLSYEGTDYEFIVRGNLPVKENDSFLAGFTLRETLGATYQIDGETVLPNTKYMIVGNHELHVTGANNYKEIINFKVTEHFENDPTVDKYFNSYKPVLSPSETVIENYKFNNNLYSKDDFSIEDIGYHKFTVIGTNGYEQEYEVKINYNYQDLLETVGSETDTFKRLKALNTQGLYLAKGELSEFNHQNLDDTKFYRIVSKVYDFKTFGNYRFIVVGKQKTLSGGEVLKFYQEFKIDVKLEAKDTTVPLLNGAELRQIITLDRINKAINYKMEKEEKGVLIPVDHGYEINTYGNFKLTLKPAFPQEDEMRTRELEYFEGVINLSYRVKPDIENFIIEENGNYKILMSEINKWKIKLTNDGVEVNGSEDIILTNSQEYKIMIVDKNGNLSQERTYKISPKINSDQYNLSENKVFFDKIEFSPENYQIKYDGKVYDPTSTFEVYKLGEVKLEILDMKGNKLRDLKCSVKPKFLELNGAERDKNFEFDYKNFANFTYKVNGVETKVPFTVNKNGKYQIELVPNDGIGDTYKASFILHSQEPTIDPVTKKVKIVSGEYYLNGQEENNLITEDTTISLLGANVIYEKYADGAFREVLVYEVGTREEIEEILKSGENFELIANCLETVYVGMTDDKLDISYKNKKEWKRDIGIHNLKYLGTTNLSNNLIEKLTVFKDEIKVSYTTEVTDYVIKENTVYYDQVNYQTLPGTSIRLKNGKFELRDNGIITKLGKSTLVIKGKNGYTKEINFEIRPSKFPVSNGQVIQETGLVIKKLDCQMFLNGKEIFGDTVIRTPRSYELKYVYEDGTVTVLNFTYKNRNFMYLWILLVAIVILALPITVVLIVRKVKIR